MNTFVLVNLRYDKKRTKKCTNIVNAIQAKIRELNLNPSHNYKRTRKPVIWGNSGFTVCKLKFCLKQFYDHYRDVRSRCQTPKIFLHAYNLV